ncbi:MAG: YfhO family protein [Lachnospiraceae bacterium]|nr:YfhO family protein [Lachnospiraceae bacterium]
MTETKPKENTRRILLLYTLLYALLMGLVFFFFRSQGRSLVYQGDGWREHLRALACYGQYLRGALRHLFIDHSLTPQTWGVDFGYGADVITSLAYSCLGDPLTAFVVFVPASRTLAFYEFLILLRPYLAGLAFCLYAFVRGEKRTAPVLTGTLLYAFSGTVLYIGLLHPYFVNPMISFPLLLSGIEHALKAKPAGEKVIPARHLVPFAVIIALATLSNFYFFYMLSILTAAYGTARLLQLHGAAGKRGRGLILDVLTDGIAFLCAGLVGVLCASVTLLPLLVHFTNDPRTAVSFARELFYSKAYYAELPRNLLSWINHPMGDTELCFALTFLPLVIFFLLRKGHRTLKICLALTVLLLLFPAGGILLNGMSYSINRWTWAVAMLAGWISVRSATELTSLLKEKGRGRTVAGLSILLPALTAASICWNVVYGFSPRFGAFPGEFRERMNSSAYLAAATENEAAAVADAVTESGSGEIPVFYRYSGRDLTWNGALATGLSSTQFEFSVANPVVSEYFQLLGVNEESNFAYFGLDDRMPALSLAGVRFYTLAYDNYYEYRYIPFGFTDWGMHGSYHVYHNPNALPLGFAMKHVMTRGELEKLPLSAHEEMLLHAAVLEDKDAAKLLSSPDCASITEFTADAVSNDLSVQEIPYSVDCGDGIRFENKAFFVEKVTDPVVITLSEPVYAGSELLLCLKNLQVNGDSAYYEPTFTAREGGEERVSKKIRYKTPASQYYSNWHDFVVNFGSAEDNITEITVVFDAPGIYTIDGLSVVRRPMEAFPDLLQALAKNALQDLDMHENPVSHATSEITGRIALPEEELLVLALPYSKGFTAFVDGKKAPVMKTDAMFLSLRVPAGEHDIRLRYRTPGFLAGGLCSLLGIILLLLMAFYRKRQDSTH